MTINGLCVCVGFAPLLARTLCAWQESLDDLVIVTTPDDRATLDLCQHARVRVHMTRVFYEGGAAFNKGAALEEARAAEYPPEGLKPSGGYAADWLLLFDADVLPERGWRRVAECAVPGCIYGAHRYQAPIEGIDDRSPLRAWIDALCPTEDGLDGCPILGVLPDEVPGCFQLFHPSDPLIAQRTPVIPTDWSHAGDYDTEFCRLWPAERRVRLPIRLLHLGEPGTYWHGVAPRDEAKQRIAAMHAERRRRGGWQHERLPS